ERAKGLAVFHQLQFSVRLPYHDLVGQGEALVVRVILCTHAGDGGHAAAAILAATVAVGRSPGTCERERREREYPPGRKKPIDGCTACHRLPDIRMHTFRLADKAQFENWTSRGGVPRSSEIAPDNPAGGET